MIILWTEERRDELVRALTEEFGADDNNAIAAADALPLGLTEFDADESDFSEKELAGTLTAKESVQLSLGYYGLDQMWAI